MLASERRVLAKLVPVGVTSAQLLLVGSASFAIGNELYYHANKVNASVQTHYISGITGRDTAPCAYFCGEYDPVRGLYTLKREQGAMALMLCSAQNQWEEVPLHSHVPVPHGVIIHLDAGSFIAKWRWVTQPPSQMLSPSQPFNSRSGLSFAVDDQVLSAVAPPSAATKAKEISNTQLDDNGLPPAKKRKRSERQGDICHSIEEVPRDAAGAPILPIQLAGGVTLVSLGVIDYDHPKFHNNRYIFPVGFLSRRAYSSMIDPNRRCVYTQEIRSASSKAKNGEEVLEPVFVLTCEELPDQPLSASTASGVWALLLEKVKAHREEIAGKKLSTNISGQEQFGLSNPITKSLIEQLPNATKCSKYWEIQSGKASSADAAPS